MNPIWIKRIMNIAGILSLVLWVAAIVMLANGNKTNRDEILKSRAANLEGRAQVLETIERVCKR